MADDRLPDAYQPLTVRLQYNRRPMTNRSNDERAISRAEARRRARLLARGELAEEPAEVASSPEPAEGGGFLRRLFPSVPPLPGKPDPLAGFDRSGPLRPIRERIFLLRRNWMAWVLTGILAVVGYLAYRFYAQGLLSLVGMFVMFGALIAAGWYGWQRPTLYGTAAGVLGFLIVASIVAVDFAIQGAGLDTFGSAGDVATVILFEGLYQAGLGFIGGWYGGYLRRRQAHLSAQTGRARR
jgi:hypothetical protein